MSTSAQKLNFITPAEYLEGEELAELRHEYFDGQVQAMSGASDRHNEIAFDIAAILKNRLKGGSRRTFLLDMKLELKPEGKTFYYYPDVFVTCAPEDVESPHIKRHPILVIEVLSPSTWRVDRGEKLHNYKSLPSISEVVFITQDWPEVVVHRRSNGWQAESFTRPDEIVRLDSINLSVALSEIYSSVEFDANQARPWYLHDGSNA